MEHGPQDHFEGSHYDAHKKAGPFSFLQPTKRYLPFPKPESAKPAADKTAAAGDSAASDDSTPPGSQQQQQQQQPEEQQHYFYQEWRSRDNRKGRHAIVVAADCADKTGIAPPKPTNTWAETWKGIMKMFVRYPVWDVSYDVATIFTWGSVIWVINGFFEWLPLQSPSTMFNGEIDLGGGITAFVGATVFEVGSVLLMLEAVNENRSDCFGWALEEALEESETAGFALLHPEHQGCTHHHKNKSSWLKKRKDQRKQGGGGQGQGEQQPADAEAEATSPEEAEKKARVVGIAGGRSPAVAQAELGDSGQGKRAWSWWPSWYELRTHYFRDIGFLACSAQMFGASVFWISGLTGLPPILNNLSVTAENGAFWVPQVIGGSGFIVSSALFMLEVQEKWWKPAPHVLGWHIGFWNLIGAIGFTLCGALGFAANNPSVAYASTLSTFIGSWAFLIGSVVQWYESLDKYPVSVLADLSHISQSNKAAAA